MEEKIWIPFETYIFEKEWFNYLEQKWLRECGLGWLTGIDIPKENNNGDKEA